MPLGDLVAAARNRALPDRAVSVTFDDGYVDNLDAGLESLERHRIPAVVYIATGYTGRPEPFWWDELETLLIGPGQRPSVLRLDCAERPVELPTRTGAERHAALVNTIQPLCQRSRPADCARVIEELRDWAGSRGGDGRPMTLDELHRLNASEMIEIGAHTHLHPSLPALPLRERAAEMRRSRALLGSWLGRAPSSFAFPFGHLSPATRMLARRSGFDHAVSTDGTVPLTSAAARFALPRMQVEDESESSLRDRLERLLAYGATP